MGRAMGLRIAATAVAVVATAACAATTGPPGAPEATESAPAPTAGPDSDAATPYLTQDGEMLVSCGGGPAWKASQTAQGLPGVLDQAQAEAIFTALLATPASVELQLTFLSRGAADTPWHILAEDGDRLSFGLGQWTSDGPVGADSFIMTVQKTGDGWVFHSGGECALFGPVPRAGSSPVHATGYALGVAAREITVQVHEGQCTSGRDPLPHLHDPSVVETSDAVTLYLTSEPVVGGADCRGNPTVTQTIVLAAPLGDRRLIDGWILPAAPLPPFAISGRRYPRCSRRHPGG